MLSKSTPFQKLNGVRPNVTDSKVIGSATQLWIPPELRNKLQAKSIDAILVGYDDQSKAYRCYCPFDRQIYVSRNITFNETDRQQFPNIVQADPMDHQFFEAIPQSSTATGSTSVIAPITTANSTPMVADPSATDVSSPTAHQSSPPSTPSPVPINVELPCIVVNQFIEPEGSTRPKRNRITSRWLKDYHHTSHLTHDTLYTFEGTSDLDESMTLREALAHPSWRKAIQSEYDSLLENGTWELTSLPADRRALSSRWILQIKPGLHPTHIRLKSRLVVKGFEQQPRLDYNETFAPMVKWSTLRTIIALAASFGWPIVHLDVIIAFLNGKLDEVIYMHQPSGYEFSGAEHLFCHLRRSIYGLKQSPHTWYSEIDSFLQSTSWICSNADPNLYIFREGSSIILLLLYVDNLLITDNDTSLIQQVQAQLQRKYKMQDLGLVQRYLGIEFVVSSHDIFLH